MSHPHLLALYDAQLRAFAEVADAPEVVRIGPLWVATFPERGRGFVTHPPLDAGVDLARLVDEVVEHFVADTRVQRFEWKTRGHDALPSLTDLLESRGLVLEEPETVVVGTVGAAIAADGGLAASPGAIREAEALAGRVFGDSPEDCARLGDELVRRVQRFPGSFEMWLVRDATGAVVCSGRVDFVEGTDFAGLWGGACDEGHRGRGLYRALTAARARSAREHGKGYLQSDCTEFSRPILQRAGLVPVTTTTPAIWRRPVS